MYLCAEMVRGTPFLFALAPKAPVAALGVSAGGGQVLNGVARARQAKARCNFWTRLDDSRCFSSMVRKEVHNKAKQQQGPVREDSVL